jgi:hypothetical protein
VRGVGDSRKGRHRWVFLRATLGAEHSWRQVRWRLGSPQGRFAAALGPLQWRSGPKRAIGLVDILSGPVSQMELLCTLALSSCRIGALEVGLCTAQYC